jgi:hypothetical protein
VANADRDHRMTISARSVAEWAAAMQDLHLAEDRAAGLATELARLDIAVRRAADVLDFDSDPTRFWQILEAAAQKNP